MKYLWLLITLLILSCSVKEVSRPTTTAKNKTLADPLILDGMPYADRGKVYKKNEAHLVTGVACVFSSDPYARWHSFEGMEQLVNLRYLSIRGDGEFLNTVDFTPLASLPKLENLTLRNGVVHRYKFKGMEHLGNLESLEIEDEEGDNLSEIDLTPLASLPKLEELRFIGNMTHLPDLTPLTNLRYIRIEGKNITRLPDLTQFTNLRGISIGTSETSANLESLEGIGAPNVRRITIKKGRNLDSLASLSNLTYLEELYLVLSSQAEKEYKMAEMVNLPNLKVLDISASGKIDFQGIENLSALEILSVLYCESFNIEGIGKLVNLKKLGIYFSSLEPSLEFLRDMPNLLELYCQGNPFINISTDKYEEVATQVLDVSPLATIKNLQRLDLYKFTIKNISALDDLEEVTSELGHINLLHSRLYDETEKSKHRLSFQIVE